MEVIEFSTIILYTNTGLYNVHVHSILVCPSSAICICMTFILKCMINIIATDIGY